MTCSEKTSRSKASSCAGAGTARTGGISTASAERSIYQAATPESAAPAAAIEEEAWSFDECPVLGFRVARSASLGDLHLVLSVGEVADGGPTSFEIPESVLRWLLTGEK